MSKLLLPLFQSHTRKGISSDPPSPNTPSALVSTAEKNVRVVNRLGLHAQPAVDLVRCAQQFQCHIQLRVRGKLYSARRVIDVLLARLDYGTEFTIVADGPDAELAVKALAAVISDLHSVDEAEVESVRTNRLRRFDLEDF